MAKSEKKEVAKKDITKEEVVENNVDLDIDLTEIKSQVDEMVKKEVSEATKKAVAKDTIAKKEISGKKTEVKAEKKDLEDGNISQKSFNEAFHAEKFKSLNVVVKDIHNTSNDKISDTIPAEDFRSEVARNEAMYGVAMRDANVIRTDNDTVTRLRSNTDNQAATTAEAGDINNVELDIQKYTISISKYTEYYLATSEMVEDAAIDVFGEATKQFGRSFAKAKDDLVFNGDGSTTGLLNVTGTNEVVASQGDAATFSAIEYKDLVDAIYGVINPQGGKFYMHRSIWAAISKVTGDNGMPIVNQQSIAGREQLSVLGYPVELVEVMPTATATALDTGFIVFGDLSRYDLALRTEMDVKVLEEGQVTPSATTYDLGEDDLVAVRARQRWGGEVSIAGAFSVIKTAATS